MSEMSINTISKDSMSLEQLKEELITRLSRIDEKYCLICIGVTCIFISGPPSMESVEKIWAIVQFEKELSFSKQFYDDVIETTRLILQTNSSNKPFDEEKFDKSKEEMKRILKLVIHTALKYS